jgi:hypothetical protein
MRVDMDRQQHYERMMALSEVGERRGRAAGQTGSVNLNQYLTSEERQNLLDSLQALNWTKGVSEPKFVANQ